MTSLPTFFAILISFALYGYSALGQEPAKSPLSFPAQEKLIIQIGDIDGCGDPTTYSQLWWTRRGAVTRIIDANTVIFRRDADSRNWEPRVLRVRLVGVDPALNSKAIKNYLTKKVLNKEVIITGNLKDEKDLELFGILSIEPSFSDVNAALIESGIARFKNFDLGHLIPYNKACQLEKAQERAKKAKLGMWATK